MCLINVFTFADKVFSFAMRVDKAGVHENDERKYGGKQKLSFFSAKAIYTSRRSS